MERKKVTVSVSTEAKLKSRKFSFISKTVLKDADAACSGWLNGCLPVLKMH